MSKRVNSKKVSGREAEAWGSFCLLPRVSKCIIPLPEAERGRLALTGVGITLVITVMIAYRSRGGVGGVPFGRSPACEWLTRARRPANGERRSLGAATNRRVLALFDVTAVALRVPAAAAACRRRRQNTGVGAGQLLILTPPLSSECRRCCRSLRVCLCK